jgi:hypothetical protein
MMGLSDMKTGTLKELNVKPGDVVECVYSDSVRYRHVVDRVTNGIYYNQAPGGALGDAAPWRVVSRATDTPKLWRDMTPEEKGALLLAHHEGKVIEYTSVPVMEEGWGIATHPSWVQKYAYRIRPEPKRETVGLWIDCRDSVGKTRIGYIDMIDGKPDPGSVKLDEI